MKMGESKLKVACLLTVATLGLSGCASVPKFWSMVTGRHTQARLDVRPVKLDASLTQATSPTDRLFASAASDIESRDYAEALDLLQVAKQQSPEDVRVLNAMAVVYDKLGRFDLSRRYYDLALVSDPQSPIVLANIRYSARLQTLAQRVGPGMMLAAGAPLPAPAPTPQRATYTAANSTMLPLASGGIRLAESIYRPIRVAPLLVGSSLLVVNATGRPGAEEPVRRLLASSGWTVGPGQETRAVQASSRITFSEAHRPVAEALARTLPFQVALVKCVTACSGVELILGQSAAMPAKGRG